MGILKLRESGDVLKLQNGKELPVEKGCEDEKEFANIFLSCPIREFKKIRATTCIDCKFYCGHSRITFHNQRPDESGVRIICGHPVARKCSQFVN